LFAPICGRFSPGIDELRSPGPAELFKPEGEPGAIRIICGASRQFDELSADLF
jgi:hypothetical protein